MTWAPTSQAFFEAKYRQNPDPWNFASAPAELFRYGRTVEALGGRRYTKAFEPACSVGVLTERLAHLCDEVLAFDLSETAVARAKERCSGWSNVEVRCASLTDLAPDPDVDLLMLSEVGYYFPADSWEQLVRKLLDRVQPRCTVLAAHWLGYSEDHCMGGDEVHQILRANPCLRLEHEERHEHFRLDRLVRV